MLRRSLKARLWDSEILSGHFCLFKLIVKDIQMWQLMSEKPRPDIGLYLDYPALFHEAIEHGLFIVYIIDDLAIYNTRGIQRVSLLR